MKNEKRKHGNECLYRDGLQLRAGPKSNLLASSPEVC